MLRVYEVSRDVRGFMWRPGHMQQLAYEDVAFFPGLLWQYNI